MLRNEHPQRMVLAAAWDDFEGRMSSVVPMPAPPTEGEALARLQLKSLTLATQLAARWQAATLIAVPMSGHWAFAPEMAALLHEASARLLARIHGTD